MDVLIARLRDVEDEGLRLLRRTRGNVYIVGTRVRTVLARSFLTVVPHGLLPGLRPIRLLVELCQVAALLVDFGWLRMGLLLGADLMRMFVALTVVLLLVVVGAGRDRVSAG